LIQKKGFLDCIQNYSFFKYNNGGSYKAHKDSNGSSFIRDSSDGICYKKANRQMDDQFVLLKKYKKTLNDYVIDDNTVQVKLIFSLFYDGVQLYKTKAVSCSPLTLTLVNLPPNLRSMQGVGAYVLYFVYLNIH
jgi:hypothetical protein